MENEGCPACGADTECPTCEQCSEYECDCEGHSSEADDDDTGEDW